MIFETLTSRAHHGAMKMLLLVLFVSLQLHTQKEVAMKITVSFMAFFSVLLTLSGRRTVRAFQPSHHHSRTVASRRAALSVLSAKGTLIFATFLFKHLYTAAGILFFLSSFVA